MCNWCYIPRFIFIYKDFRVINSTVEFSTQNQHTTRDELYLGPVSSVYDKLPLLRKMGIDYYPIMNTGDEVQTNVAIPKTVLLISIKSSIPIELRLVVDLYIVMNLEELRVRIWSMQ